MCTYNMHNMGRSNLLDMSTQAEVMQYMRTSVDTSGNYNCIHINILCYVTLISMVTL